MIAIAPEIQKQWSVIAPILTIRSEQDYDQAVERLSSLIDEVGTNEGHPLYTLLDTLGILMEAYEETHHSIPDSDSVDILTYLMEEHTLCESDLPEIGTEETVIEVLTKKKELDLDQIRALANRFSVSPSVFI